MRIKDIKWAKWPWARCPARKEPNVAAHWGRCERARLHYGDHAIRRKGLIIFWSTDWTMWYNEAGEITVDQLECNCSIHDITTPGAAHADDCPMYD